MTARPADAADRPAGAARPPGQPAPPYIRRSRKMIVERLEQELTAGRGTARPDNRQRRKRQRPGTIPKSSEPGKPSTDARRPPGPDRRRARRSRRRLPDDLRLLEGSSRTRSTGSTPAPASPATLTRSQPPSYDEHSSHGRREASNGRRKMHEKDTSASASSTRNRRSTKPSRLASTPISPAPHERVDWAKKMFEKGYVSKGQYDAEILKHYDALKARIEWARARRIASTQRTVPQGI